jgi:hypothetical protein
VFSALLDDMLVHLEAPSCAQVFHPDVYTGDGDATAITARLNLAYEIVVDEVTGGGGGDDDVYGADGELVDPEPFNDPKGVADRIFVNELRCVLPAATPQPSSTSLVGQQEWHR